MRFFTKNKEALKELIDFTKLTCENNGPNHDYEDAEDEYPECNWCGLEKADALIIPSVLSEKELKDIKDDCTVYEIVLIPRMKISTKVEIKKLEVDKELEKKIAK